MCTRTPWPGMERKGWAGQEKTTFWVAFKLHRQHRRHRVPPRSGSVLLVVALQPACIYAC